jgi:ABC-type transport system involved in cytochrome bd biosynthesis fused ATPase/permease subunit
LEEKNIGIPKEKWFTNLVTVGNVGSGKSSLLAALLGQMQLVEGNSKICGTISYTPQEAWLLNMTLRDNITFGSDFDEVRYKEVIKICALELI